jgi:hypothetical protein
MQEEFFLKLYLLKAGAIKLVTQGQILQTRKATKTLMK